MRYVTSSIALLLVSSLAWSQDYAEEALAQSPRHGEWVYIDAGDGDKVSAFVVYPERSDASDSVVVIHDIMAMSAWARLVGDELAKAGYLAVVPDLLSGKAENGGDSADFADAGARGRAMRALDPAEVDRRIKACVDYARAVAPTTDEVSVGGFCWGGATTFRYATYDPSIVGAHVFYGNPPSEEALAKISMPVYGYYAEFDNRINATLDATTETMSALDKTFDPVMYPEVGHGFVRNGMGPSANDQYKQQTALAWERWLALLAK